MTRTFTLLTFLICMFGATTANCQDVPKDHEIHLRVGMTGSGAFAGFQEQIPNTIIGFEMEAFGPISSKLPLETGLRVNSTKFGKNSWDAPFVDDLGNATDARYNMRSNGTHIFALLRLIEKDKGQRIKPYLEVFAGPSKWRTKQSIYPFHEDGTHCPEELIEESIVRKWTLGYGAGTGVVYAPFKQNTCARILQFYAGAEVRQFGNIELMLDRQSESTIVAPRQLNFKLGLNLFFDPAHKKNCDHCRQSDWPSGSWGGDDFGGDGGGSGGGSCR